VAAKSPLTGIWGEADSGGRFGISLKAAGYDAIAITGRASAPSVLSITEGDISVVSAESVWGRDTFDTHDILAQKYGSKASLCFELEQPRRILDQYASLQLRFRQKQRQELALITDKQFCPRNAVQSADHRAL
jgi:hypothetical protein